MSISTIDINYHEILVGLYPVVSELRHLFQYFMLSEEDVYLIQCSYMKLAETPAKGISVGRLLAFIGLHGQSFYENYLNYGRNENGFINYYVLVKIVLFHSFVPVNNIMINCFKYLDSLVTASEISSIDPKMMFLNMYQHLPEYQDISKNYNEEPPELRNSFSKFILSKCADQKYTMLYREFYTISDSIKRAFFDQVRLSFIRTRILFCRDYFYYFQKHARYPPLSLCEKVKKSLYHLPNKNKFDYFMSPERRDRYSLPYMFSQVNVQNRTCSTIFSSQNASFFSRSMDYQKFFSSYKKKYEINSKVMSITEANNNPNYRASRTLRTQASFGRNNNRSHNIIIINKQSPKNNPDDNPLQIIENNKGGTSNDDMSVHNINMKTINDNIEICPSIFNEHCQKGQHLSGMIGFDRSLSRNKLIFNKQSTYDSKRKILSKSSTTFISPAISINAL